MRDVHVPMWDREDLDSGFYDPIEYEMFSLGIGEIAVANVAADFA